MRMAFIQYIYYILEIAQILPQLVLYYMMGEIV